MNSDVLSIPTKRRSVVNGAVHAKKRASVLMGAVLPKNGRRKRIRVLIGSWVFGWVPETERIGRTPYHPFTDPDDIPSTK